MVRRFLLLVALAGLLLLPIQTFAHEGRGQCARLAPPVENAPFPEARGEVVLNSVLFLVNLEHVAPGEYPVLLDDGTGALQKIGAITAVADEEEDEDEGDDGDDNDDEGHGCGDPAASAEGVLRLQGTELPFGAASPADLAGRKIQVQDAAGAVVVEGMTPAVIEPEPEPHSGRCDLSRPDPAVDPDAEGAIKFEEGEGRIVIKVYLQNLDPGKVYEVFLSKPDGSATESLGKVTADEEGTGRLKLDSEKGDAIPFGAGSLAELEGYGVTVKDEAGAVILQGSVCAVQVLPPEDDEGDHEDECEAKLAPPESAADADAEGEVELELGATTQVLEIEVENLAAVTTYGVSLTDPAEGGATEKIGEIVTDAEGEGKLEIRAAEGVTLPFGKAAVADLAGFAVAVTLTTVVDTTETTVDVLEGSVPAADCAAAGDDDEDDDEADHHDGDDDERDDGHGDEGDGHQCRELGDGGGASFVVPDEPIFVMVGRFDEAFLRGDMNRDWAVDISDAVGTLSYLFVGASTPYCLDAADANDDGHVDIADPISLLGYLFLGMPAPGLPGVLIPGSDPTADLLYCEEQPAQ